jgi:hypothetical protein
MHVTSNHSMKQSYPVRPMKRFWQWELMLLMLICGASILLCALRETLWYGVFAFLAIFLFLFRMMLFVHCPACAGRMRAHSHREPGSTTTWFLYDCNHCRTTWNPGFGQSD